MVEYRAGMVVQDRCRCGNPGGRHVRYRIQHIRSEAAQGVLLLNLATQRLHRTSVRQLEAGYDVVLDNGQLAPPPPQRTRPRPTRQESPALGDANQARTAAAAPRMCADVQHALKVLGIWANPKDAQAGRLRLQHPDATLAELAALANPPLTKDTVAGRLRRLLTAARRHAGQKTS